MLAEPLTYRDQPLPAGAKWVHAAQVRPDNYREVTDTADP